MRSIASGAPDPSYDGATVRGVPRNNRCTQSAFGLLCRPRQRTHAPMMETGEQIKKLEKAAAQDDRRESAATPQSPPRRERPRSSVEPGPHADRQRQPSRGHQLWATAPLAVASSSGAADLALVSSSASRCMSGLDVARRLRAQNPDLVVILDGRCELPLSRVGGGLRPPWRPASPSRFGFEALRRAPRQASTCTGPGGVALLPFWP